MQFTSKLNGSNELNGDQLLIEHLRDSGVHAGAIQSGNSILPIHRFVAVKSCSFKAGRR